jgi:chemotaxis protein MotB
MARPTTAGRATSPRRRGRQETEGRSNAWLTTYADAVTLLLAFFVLLYAMSEIDVMKFTAFLEGLRVPFGNEAGDGLLPETDGLEPEHDPVPQLAEEERPELPDHADQPDLQELLPDRDDALPVEAVIHAVQRQQQADQQLDHIAAALDRALTEAGLVELVELRREERGLVVSIASDDVLFALGSTRIDAVGRQVIAVVARTLDGFPNPLLVEGHTDNVPLDRAGYTNWNLSTDRAVAVLSRMIEQHGLPPDRVAASGYGEYHPLESNDTSSGRARNRRVHIVVLVEEIAP